MINSLKFFKKNFKAKMMSIVKGHPHRRPRLMNVNRSS
jgi:hypothetical protein